MGERAARLVFESTGRRGVTRVFVRGQPQVVLLVLTRYEGRCEFCGKAGSAGGRFYTAAAAPLDDRRWCCYRCLGDGLRGAAEVVEVATDGAEAGRVDDAGSAAG